MKLLIILNGDCNDYSFLKKLSEQYDCIYCADGGLNHARKADITPDLVIGDFDSSEFNAALNTLRFPVEKDDTDSEIAIKEGLSNGFDSVTLTCALGGRCDHLLTNVLLLSRFSNVRIEEHNCSIEMLENYKLIENQTGKTVSFIPLEKSYIKLSGFKYPMDGSVEIGTTLTMSNVVVNEKAEVKIKYGKVIMIITK